jgi:hypothetical protein
MNMMNLVMKTLQILIYSYHKKNELTAHFFVYNSIFMVYNRSIKWR